MALHIPGRVKFENIRPVADSRRGAFKKIRPPAATCGIARQRTPPHGLRTVRAAIEDFILHLATERGLSVNYQLSTRLSLEGFALWLERGQLVKAMGQAALDDLLQRGEEPPPVATDPGAVTLDQIGAYLAHKKRLGLSAASIKLIVVAVKIFFRWLHARRRIPHDVAENLQDTRDRKSVV